MRGWSSLFLYHDRIFYVRLYFTLKKERKMLNVQMASYAILFLKWKSSKLGGKCSRKSPREAWYMTVKKKKKNNAKSWWIKSEQRSGFIYSFLFHLKLMLRPPQTHIVTNLREYHSIGSINNYSDVWSRLYWINVGQIVDVIYTLSPQKKTIYIYSRWVSLDVRKWFNSLSAESIICSWLYLCILIIDKWCL